MHRKDRRSPCGGIYNSKRTDSDGARLASVKGVAQGYCPVASVDGRQQIIVEAKARGTGSQQAPLVEAIGPQLTDDSSITADAGYPCATVLDLLGTRR